MAFFVQKASLLAQTTLHELFTLCAFFAFGICVTAFHFLLLVLFGLGLRGSHAGVIAIAFLHEGRLGSAV